jgi:hypothetical protein
MELESEYPLLGASQPDGPPKIKLTELITALTGLVSVILARGQTDRVRFWGIIAVGLAIALVGVYRPLFAVVRALVQRRHNDRATHKHMPEFRRFAREAGRFLNSDIARNDALGGILHGVQSRLSGQPHHTLFTVLTRIPQLDIFLDRWICFNKRIQKDNL